MQVYGCHAETVNVLEARLAIRSPSDPNAVIATLFYLRIGQWELSHCAYLGWCFQNGERRMSLRYFKDLVKKFLLTRVSELADFFLDPESEWLKPAFDHATNDTHGIVPNCKFAVDTVPCQVENVNNSNVNYNAKYAASVMKKLSF